MYRTCESCKSFRSDGDLPSCLACRSCGGTGIVRDPDSYVCNGCGGGLCPRNDSCPYGLVEAVVDGGYSSTHLSDSVNYRFSLCEKCLREMFDKFAVPPATWSDVGGDLGYAADAESHRLRSWRESGGQAAKLATGLCNASPECQNVAEWRVFYSGYMGDGAVCSAHRRAAAFRNCRFVPAGHVSDIPAEKSDRTLEQKVRLADEFLKAAARPDGSPTCFRYLGECVGDVAADGRSSGGFWVPSVSAVPDPSFSDDPALQSVFTLPSGLLFLCDPSLVEQLARRYGFSPEPGLEELYPELCGDDVSAVGD